MLSRDERPRIFLDFQGSVENPLEMVALLACGARVDEVKVFLGRNKRPTAQDKHDIKYVHGLFPMVSKGYLKKWQMVDKLASFIREKNPVEIVIQRHESRKFLKAFKSKIVKVNLRKWRQRPAHYVTI